MRGFSGIFLHYILDKFGALGQAEAEVGEQEGDIGVGLGQGEHAFGAFDRDGDIHGADVGEGGDDFAGTGAEAFGLHPYFQRPPQGEAQKADEQMGFDPVGFLMIDRAQAQIAFGRAESGFGLGEFSGGRSQSYEKDTIPENYLHLFDAK